MLYLAVRVSPLGIKPTVTITVLVLALAGVVLYGLSGQAIGPGRYLACLIRYRLAAKHLTPPERADKHGLVLDAAPDSTELAYGVDATASEIAELLADEHPDSAVR